MNVPIVQSLAARVMDHETVVAKALTVRTATVRSALGLVSLIAFMAPACRPHPDGSQPFPGYAHVISGPDCRPAGGSAVALVFRQQPDSFDAPGPQLRITVWRDIRAVPGRSIASADRPSPGAAYECTDSNTCSELRRWRIRFDRGSSDSTLAGELEIQADQGPGRRGRFQAAWHSRVVYCI